MNRVHLLVQTSRKDERNTSQTLREIGGQVFLIDFHLSLLAYLNIQRKLIEDILPSKFFWPSHILGLKYFVRIEINRKDRGNYIIYKSIQKTVSAFPIFWNERILIVRL